MSVAIVKPDHSAIVEGALNAINLCAAAVSTVNAKAGVAIQTASVLGGWIWNSWKFDRVAPVIEEVSKRIQEIENEYVRRDEFADLLAEVLERIADQPDEDRRNALRNILLRIIDKPREHVENRRIVRIADELATAQWKVLHAVNSIPLPINERTRGWSGSVASALGMSDEEVRSIVDDAVDDRLMIRDAIITMPAMNTGPGCLRMLLTPLGQALMTYAAA